MGYTLTLQISEEVYKSLKKTAEQNGQPTEALAVLLLTNATKNITDDPLEDFIGKFNSNGVNWSNKHDEFLGNFVAKKIASEKNDEV